MPLRSIEDVLAAVVVGGTAGTIIAMLLIVGVMVSDFIRARRADRD